MIDDGSVGVALDLSRDDWADTARRLEALGVDTLWLAGGQLDRLERVDEVLAATSTVQVATGIVPLGVFADDAVAALGRRTSERFVLGLGGPQQARPLAALRRHLDALDEAGLDPGDRLLAALGPRKLAIARERTAGAITLLVTPEATAAARAALGPDARLVVHQFAVADEDAGRARAAIRGPLGFLTQVDGYRASFARMGLRVEEIDSSSDRLVDLLAVWGSSEAIGRRLAAHRAAGADQVVLSLLATDASDDPVSAVGAVLPHLRAGT